MARKNEPSNKVTALNKVAAFETVAEAAETDQSGYRYEQLSQRVTWHLREQIVSGTLKEGQFLRIDAIAKALSISMTPVREGLLLLQNEGFVRLIPRRGFIVNSFCKEDVLDLFWAQATIGAELAARAAEMMSDEEIEQLENLEQDYRKAVSKQKEPEFLRKGHQFHRAINLAAQSPSLAMLLGSLTKRLPNRFYNSIDGRLTDAVESHPIILAAIKNRDAECARKLMFEHINGGGAHLVAMLERQGVWGSVEEAPDDPKVTKTLAVKRNKRK